MCVVVRKPKDSQWIIVFEEVETQNISANLVHFPCKQLELRNINKKKYIFVLFWHG